MYSNNKKAIVEKNNDRIYYNIAIPGSNTSTTNSGFFNFVPANYVEQLNQSIIDNPSDYYMTIVRFTIPTQIIPIFIFEAQPFPNTTDKDLGIYSVTLEYNGNFSPETFVRFITVDPTAEQPQPPTNVQNRFWTRTLYYYVYNYTDFLVMINTALSQAFTDLPFPAPTTPPFFIYTPETQLISLIADKAFYDLSLVNPVKIYFNYHLQRFVDGLPSIFYSTNDPLGRDTQFVIKDLKNNTYLLPNIAAPPTYLITTQNYNTLSDWNSFKSLQITTNLIPIRNEYVPSSQNINNVSGNVNLRGVITDFEPLLDTGAESRTTIQYQQSGPYRLVNMTDINPLTKIDISVYWTDELLNTYLLYVPEGQVLTLKIAFIKKSTFEGY